MDVDTPYCFFDFLKQHASVIIIILWMFFSQEFLMHQELQLHQVISHSIINSNIRIVYTASCLLILLIRGNAKSGDPIQLYNIFYYYYYNSYYYQYYYIARTLLLKQYQYLLSIYIIHTMRNYLLFQLVRSRLHSSIVHLKQPMLCSLQFRCYNSWM